VGFVLLESLGEYTVKLPADPEGRLIVSCTVGFVISEPAVVLVAMV
jgi:hypothetical protein